MHDGHASYLETQLRTSTPQKLRLMLIEGAIRFLQRAQLALESLDLESFANDLSRCRDIATELLLSIQLNSDLDFVRTTQGIYGFVLRELTQIQLHRDPVKIAGVLRVLTEDQITWSQVCDIETETLPGMMQQTLAGVLPIAGASFSLEA
jgi:flagellar secretion chaperone FliS